MKYPVCPNVDLLMAERQGGAIDYCPNCRRVLDRENWIKFSTRTVGCAHKTTHVYVPQPNILSRDCKSRIKRQKDAVTHVN